MKSVMVTGGAGFIGSNFVRYLLEAEPGIRLVNLDALTYAGSLENLKDVEQDPRYTFIRGDICDAGLLRETLRGHQIDTIVNFAAETHVDRSILGPGQFLQTNVVGTFTLLEAARNFWLEEKGVPPETTRFHQVSTDEVFGALTPEAPAVAENSPYAPNSPYAATKAASDHLVRAYGATYHLHYLITNASNNFGPYQFPEKLIPLMVLNAIEGKSLPVYGDGQQIRDWLHVQDHCEALYLALSRAPAGSTYNIGGRNQLTNLSVVETICQIFDEFEEFSGHRPHAHLIDHVDDRPGHDRRYAMNTGKIERELGWRPRISLADGLRSTVAWYLAHPAWVAAIRRQPDYRSWIEKNYNTRQATGE